MPQGFPSLYITHLTPFLILPEPSSINNRDGIQDPYAWQILLLLGYILSPWVFCFVLLFVFCLKISIRLSPRITGKSHHIQTWGGFCFHCFASLTVLVSFGLLFWKKGSCSPGWQWTTGLPVTVIHVLGL